MTATQVTPAQLDILRHALGVHRLVFGWSRPYRNRYTVVFGSEAFANCDALAKEGLMTERHSGDISTFAVTEAGERVALAGLRFSKEAQNVR